MMHGQKNIKLHIAVTYFHSESRAKPDSLAVQC